MVKEHTEGGDEMLTVTVRSTGAGGAGGDGGTRAVFNMTEGFVSQLQLLGSSDGGVVDVDLLETSERQGQGANVREDQDKVRQGVL